MAGPCVESLSARAQQLDDAVERWVASVRRPELDPLFYGLSSAADHGLLWLALGTARAARNGSPGDALVFGALMGAESALTNGPIKLAFRRMRPEHEHPDVLPWGMHRPITSSFPSGHAVSAFTAATLLATRRTAPAYFALAGLVATSRVYVRLHHASDVVAGAALGVGLGLAARRALRRRSPGRRWVG